MGGSRDGIGDMKWVQRVIRVKEYTSHTVLSTLQVLMIASSESFKMLSAYLDTVTIFWEIMDGKGRSWGWKVLCGRYTCYDRW